MKSRYISGRALYLLVGVVSLAMWFSMLSTDFYTDFIVGVYVLFMPGLSILPLIFPGREISHRKLLYSIPLSIFFVSAVGVILTLVDQATSISTPISLIPNALLVSSSAFFILWRRLDIERVEVRCAPRGLLLFGVLVSLFISGSLISESGTTNSILILSFMISVAFLTILNFNQSDKFAHLYGWFIWAFSIGIIGHVVIGAALLRPTDNTGELFLIKNSLSIGYWNFELSRSANAMPSVIFLPASITLPTKSSTLTVFRYLAPAVSSLIPVIIYSTIKEYHTPKVGLNTSFIFIVLFNYFSWYSMTMKMAISGLFLSFLLYYTLTTLDHKRERLMIFLLFSGLALSHYGTTVLLLIAVSISYVVYLSVSNSIIKLEKYGEVMKISIIAFFGIFAVVWYMYVASGTIFRDVSLILANFVLSIPELILGSQSSYSQSVVDATLPASLAFTVRSYFVLYFFMGIGSLISIKHICQENLVSEYELIGLSMMVLIVLTHVSGSAQYGGGRIWVLSGFFAIPFAVLGMEELFRYTTPYGSRTLIVVLLGAFLIFNSGLAAETVWSENVGPSPFISEPRISSSGSVEEKELLQRISLSSTEDAAMSWLSRNSGTDPIFADRNARTKLHIYGFFHHTKNLGRNQVYNLVEEKQVLPDSYIIARDFNKEQNTFVQPSFHFFPKFISANQTFTVSNSVYSNGRSEVLKKS